MTLDRPNIHTWLLAVMLLVCWGCASVDRQTARDVWSCDPRADEAVRQEEWPEALELHQTLLQKDPGNCLAQYHLGYIQGRLGDRLQETEAYRRAVACGYSKDDQLFFNLGMAYTELGQFESAITAFGSAVSLKSERADHHFGLGLTWSALGNLESALESFERAVGLDANHLGARVRLVHGLLDQNRFDECRTHAEALKTIAPDDPQVIELLRRYDDRRITRYEK